MVNICSIRCFCLALILCFCCIGKSSFAQNAIVAGGGDFFVSGIGGMSASIGLVDYSYAEEGGISVTAGLQHAFFVEPDLETNSSFFKNEKFSIRIAPNPTSDYCNISLTDNVYGVYRYVVMDVMGHVLAEGVLDDGMKVSLAGYDKGTYLLKVVTDKNNDCVVVKIIKD